MYTTILTQLINRDLEKLKTELQAYENEADMWKLGGDIKNSAGNLTLHLIGNLNHFIGHALGSNGYVRDREREFGDKHVPVSDMLGQIDEIQAMLTEVLPKVTEEQLQADFPIQVFKGKTFSTGLFLGHLLTHLSYHLGQINYHRRLINK